MKPVYLKLQAFSTYMNVEIDFHDLNKQGLYLIYGETGAGKTTLFDAMSYALFATASGSNRSSDVFRSSYASYDIPTIVEFTFDLHHQRYMVHREISYTKTGNRRPDIALLYKGEELISEGKLPVTKKIESLTGVNSRQFKQIVMIAQGEFNRLLYADSKEKEQIFRHLFHTEYIQNAQEKLKEKARDVRQQYEEVAITLNTYVSSLEQFPQDTYQFNTLSLLEEHIHNLSKKYKVSLENIEEREKVYQSLTNQYYQDQTNNKLVEDYEEKSIQLKTLESKQKHYLQVSEDIKLSKSAKEIHNLETQTIQYQNKLQQSKQQYQDIQKEHTTIQDTYKQHESSYKEIPLYQKQLEELSFMIHKFEDIYKQKQQYDANLIELEHLDKQYQNLKIEYEHFHVDYQKKLKRMEADQKRIDSLPDLIVDYQELDRIYKDTIERHAKLHDLKDLYDERISLRDQYFDEVDIYTKALDLYNQKNKEYHHEQLRFHKGQAGLLAQELVENTPCPVCGSIHHPSPALLDKSILSIQELDKLEQRLNRYKEDYDLKYNTSLQTKARLSHLEQQVNTFKNELEIEDHLSKELFITLLNDILQLKEHQYRKVNTINNEIIYLNKLKDSVSQDQKTRIKFDKQIDTYQKDIYDLETKKNKYMTENSYISTHYDIYSVDKDSLNELQEQYQTLSDKIKNLTDEESSLSQQLLTLSTTLSVLEKDIKQLEKDYQLSKESFDKEVLQAFKDINEYHYYLSINSDDLQEELTTYTRELFSLQTQVSDLKEKVKDIKKKDLSVLAKQLDQYSKDKIRLDEEDHKMIQQYENTDIIYKKIKRISKKQESIFEDYQYYDHLSKITSGNNHDKLSFERYVLASYFNIILRYANVELEKLTLGRFQFERRIETKGSAGQGLDLNILDYETGVYRDIKSLSGGESFKAALALALGVSSMIQDFAGGIELQSLFIDEGFGSLDEESLQQAILVLNQMKDGQKVIGIISHVQQLKDAIPAHINVKRGNNGSIVEIEV